jgi:hypothetical protein
LSVAILLSSLPSIQAALVITNGSFELNGGAGSTTLTNWTTVDSGNGDTYAQSGVTSPLSGFAVPAPTQGTFAAMTDQGGPGTHIFYQDFLVPFGIASGTLDFDLFIGNRDGNFTPGNPLDHTAVSPNQLARVDILKGGSAPASILPADVLLNVYQTQAADPLVSGYTPINANLTALLQAHQGETLRSVSPRWITQGFSKWAWTTCDWTRPRQSLSRQRRSSDWRFSGRPCSRVGVRFSSPAFQAF